jgi:uncharacterized protein YjbJ (UPF0337 family)
VSMNKDQAEGNGKLVGKETLETRGKMQGVLAKVQARYGDVRQHVKDSLKKDA